MGDGSIRVFLHDYEQRRSERFLSRLYVIKNIINEMPRQGLSMEDGHLYGSYELGYLNLSVHRGWLLL